MEKKSVIKSFISLALVSCMAMATACGGGETSSTEGTSDGKVYIEVCDLIKDKSGVDGLLYNRQQKFAKEYPNIVVTHSESVVDDSTKTVQQIIEEINSDDACTLMLTTAANYARSLYQMGVIEDWKPLLQDSIHDLRPEIVEALTSSTGALTGFPTTLDTPLIGFNRAHLRSEYVRKAFLGDNYNAANALDLIEAELDQIKTWDEYKAVLTKLTGKYVVDFIETDVSGYGGYYTDFYLGIGVWLIANGYGISTQNADGTLNVDLNEPTTKEAIEFLQGLSQDGITKIDVGIGFQDFYNKIFQNQVASFIYYPAWNAWFQDNAMYADDIKVINIPYGPSVAADIEAGKTVKTNPSFSNTWVMNKNATDAEKRAAVTYMLYMYSEEAMEEKYEYILENDIETFSLPALNINDEYMENTILEAAPTDWKSSIMVALDNLFVLKPDTDAWRMYISSDVPSLLKKDTEYRGDALANRLKTLTDRIKTEWLNTYNAEITK